MIRQDPRVYLLTGDLGWGVFDELLRNFPKQCINVGIAEQNMIGIAAGLALELKKVFCYSIVPFITMRAYEQVRVDICSHNLDVTIIGVGGGFAYGMLGNTHYGIEDINVMRWLPNMQIFCPVDKIEITGGLEYIKKNSWPLYIRLNIWGEQNILDEYTHIDIVNWTPLYEKGQEVILFSTGRIGATVQEVAKKLWENNIQVSAYTIPLVKPLSDKIILDHIKESHFVFSIEEHSIYGGLWSAIAELIAESDTSPRFTRIGIEDEFFYTAWDQEYMKKTARLDVDTIYSRILEKIHD